MRWIGVAASRMPSAAAIAALRASVISSICATISARVSASVPSTFCARSSASFAFMVRMFIGLITFVMTGVSCDLTNEVVALYAPTSTSEISLRLTALSVRFSPAHESPPGGTENPKDISLTTPRLTRSSTSASRCESPSVAVYFRPCASDSRANVPLLVLARICLESCMNHSDAPAAIDASNAPGAMRSVNVPFAPMSGLLHEL